MRHQCSLTLLRSRPGPWPFVGRAPGGHPGLYNEKGHGLRFPLWAWGANSDHWRAPCNADRAKAVWGRNRQLNAVMTCERNMIFRSWRAAFEANTIAGRRPGRTWCWLSPTSPTCFPIARRSTALSACWPKPPKQRAPPNAGARVNLTNSVTQYAGSSARRRLWKNDYGTNRAAPWASHKTIWPVEICLQWNGLPGVQIDIAGIEAHATAKTALRSGDGLEIPERLHFSSSPIVLSPETVPSFQKWPCRRNCLEADIGPHPSPWAFAPETSLIVDSDKWESVRCCGGSQL